MHVKFLKVFEAVTLIIQSITYPNIIKANNKPTICALTPYKFKMIDVDYELALSTKSLEKYLFKEVNYLFIFIKLYNINLNLFFSPQKK